LIFDRLLGRGWPVRSTASPETTPRKPKAAKHAIPNRPKPALIKVVVGVSHCRHKRAKK
jgi:hypothetical protein